MIELRKERTVCRCNIEVGFKEKDYSREGATKSRSYILSYILSTFSSSIYAPVLPSTVQSHHISPTNHRSPFQLRNRPRSNKALLPFLISRTPTSLVFLLLTSFTHRQRHLKTACIQFPWDRSLSIPHCSYTERERIHHDTFHAQIQNPPIRNIVTGTIS